jgi:CRP-like cAMP-binding protein
MIDAARFLATVYLFSFMEKRHLQQIAKHTRYQDFSEGDFIIREGDRDNRLLMVVRGRVEVVSNLGHKNEKYLGIFGPFSYFGEMALLDDLARSASVIAKGDTGILSLDQRALHQEIRKIPAVAFELLRMLNRRVRVMEKNMTNSLGPFLTICSNCKMIRESGGSWTPIEEYITDHSETEFSHSFCPECARKLYQDFFQPDHHNAFGQEL